MKRLRKILKWTCIALLSVIVLVVIAVAVVLRTDFGHRKIVSIALPIVNKVFAGQLSVGKLSGGILADVDVDDAVLTDADGDVVARVGHLHASYSVFGFLLHKHITVYDAKLQNVWARGRFLKDGALNFAELTRPSDAPPAPPSPPAKHPIVIDIEHVTLSGKGRFEQEKGAQPAVLAGDIALEGSAKITGSVVDASVKELTVKTTLAPHAELAVRGNAHIDGGATSVAGVHIDVKTTARELRPFLPNVKLQGAYEVTVDANGPIKKLDANIAVKLPGAGTVDIKAQAELKSQFVWAALVSARKLDPGALVEDLPHGAIRFDADGHGVNKDGDIILKGLDVDMPGLKVGAHANATLTLSGKVQGEVTVKATDLSKLRGFGVPDLAGALDVHAKVGREGGHIAIDAKVAGDHLAAKGARVGHLDVDVKSLDLRGHAHVLAKNVAAAGKRIDVLALDAEGTRTQLSFGLQTTGPDNLRALIRGRGTPIYEADRKTIRGAKLSLERLELGFAKEEWTLQAPVAISYDKALQVGALDLENTRSEHIELQGSYGPDGAVNAKVKTSALNVQPVIAAFKADAHVPTTKLFLDAAVAGTTKQPHVHAKLNGESSADKATGLPQFDFDIEGDYTVEKAVAKLRIGSAGQHLNGDVVVPMNWQTQPVHVALKADKIDLAPIIRTLRGDAAADPDEAEGTLAFSIAVDGPLRAPIVEISANLPHWKYQEYGHNDTQLHAHYENKLAQLTFATVNAMDDKPAGKLDLQLNVPIDAALLIGKKHVSPRALIDEAKLSGKVQLTDVHITRMPWRVMGLASPVNRGRLNATVDLNGSLAAPTVDLEAKATELVPGEFHDADVALSLKYAAKQAKLSTIIDVRKVHFVDVEGLVKLDVGRLLTGAGGDVKTAPLNLELTFPDYDLSKLADVIPQLAGTLHGKFIAKGTLAGLTAKTAAAATGSSLQGELDADNLAVGPTKYSKFALRAEERDAKVTLDIAAAQANAGTLHVAANAPLTFSTADVALDADKFVIDLTLPQSAPLPRIAGTLQSNLHAHVASGDVALSGAFNLTKGQLAIAGQSRPYEDINLQVKFDKNTITVPQLSMRASSGKASATASVTLNHLALQNASATVKLQGFPVAGGPIAIALDTEATANAWQDKDVLNVKVNVKKGSARLPKVADQKGVQPLGDLKDVTFTDRRAVRQRAREAKAASKGGETLVAVSVPGPFHLVSPDLSADLKADLHIRLAGGKTFVSGSVDTTTGSVQILSREYRIERAHVDLNGSADPNPGLDIRVSRDVTSATITAEVQGTSRKPKLVLLSNPPVYSEAEILSMIISGDPAAQDTPDQPLDAKVISAVSGAIVGRIKDQIAPQLPIDVIKIDVGANDYTPFSSARLEVGKFLTDSIYVSYAHRFGTQVTLRPVNENEGSLEYRFLRHYTLQTVFGDEAVGSIDLFWSKRY